jgi:8-oxo-dGTP pyrophosphatase MutT (NUDIX family)
LTSEQRHVDAGLLRRVLGGRTGRPTDPAWQDDSRPAAVLAAFYERDGPGEPGARPLEVILTRRAWSLRSHTGEVSFPGGRSDDGETPVATALREAQEEIALDPAEVEVLGELDHFISVVSRSFIVPVVALLDGRPSLRAAEAEVDAILHVPLEELLIDEVFREEIWPFPPVEPWASIPDAGPGGGGRVERPIYFFELHGDTVWGATANMLRHLLCLVLGLPADPYL